MKIYMKDKLLEIINNYGVLPQLKYFQSEVFEFNEAVIQFENGNWLGELDPENAEIKAKQHITEEFADVMVMLEQFKAYYELDNKKIMEIMEYKINRQIDRIKNEN